MIKKLVLCSFDDIPEGASRGKIAVVNGQRTSLILVRKCNKIYVYQNICPHIRAPLDFEPGRFLNYDKSLILCAMHGALFNIETGECVDGPCLGKYLMPVAIKIINNDVFIDE